MNHRATLALALCLAALAGLPAAAAMAGEVARADTSRAAGSAGIQLEGVKPGEFVVVDEVPAAIVRVPPKYPQDARERGEQGTVFVRAIVRKDGVPVRVGIPEGKGVSAGLDSAAVQAVRRWRFSPAKVKGRPVAVWIVLPVKFALH